MLRLWNVVRGSVIRLSQPINYNMLNNFITILRDLSILVHASNTVTPHILFSEFKRVLFCCQGAVRTAQRSGKGVSEEIYNSSVCGTQEQNNFKSDNHITFVFEDIQGGSQVYIFFENSHRTKVHHMKHMSDPNRTLVPTLLYILALLCQSDYYLHTDDIFVWLF